MLPALDVGEVVAGEAIFEADPERRNRGAPGEVAELPGETPTVAIVRNPDRTILDPEGVAVIVAVGVAGDLRAPAVQRLAVKDRPPRRLGTGGGDEQGGCGERRRGPRATPDAAQRTCPISWPIAFFDRPGSFAAAAAASALLLAAPTWIRPTMPMPTCGRHL